MTETRRPWYGSVHYLVVAVFLLVTAASWNSAMEFMKVALKKHRVDLLAPLESLPTEVAVPDGGGRFVLADQGEVPGAPTGKIRLPSDVEETLGTENYIIWIYRYEPDGATGATPTFIRLHVAYYTDILDAVPHVADVCQLAGGAQPLGKPTGHVWPLTGLPPGWEDWQDVEIRRSAFLHRLAEGGERHDVVYYVFNVNGKHTSDRLGVRKELANPFVRYCYYAKIELSPMGAALTPEAGDEVCRKFFTAMGPKILALMAPKEQLDKLEQAD